MISMSVRISARSSVFRATMSRKAISCSCCPEKGLGKQLDIRTQTLDLHAHVLLELFALAGEGMVESFTLEFEGAIKLFVLAGEDLLQGLFVQFHGRRLYDKGTARWQRKADPSSLCSSG